MPFPNFAGQLAQAWPFISIDPEFGYEQTSPSINRLPDQLLYALKFLKIPDAKFERYLPALSSTSSNALEVDVTTTASVTAQDPYDVEPITPTSRSKRYVLTEIAGEVPLTGFNEVDMANPIDPVAIQIRGKRRAIKARFGRLFFVGSTAIPGQFDGVDALIAQGYGQSFVVSLPNPLDELSKMISLLMSNDRDTSDLFFITSSPVWRAIERLIREQGSQPQESYEPCPLLPRNAKALYISGIPLLISDLAPNDQSNSYGSIYLISRSQLVGAVNEKQPDVSQEEVQFTLQTARSWKVFWRVVIASLTGLGLVACYKFPADFT